MYAKIELEQENMRIFRFEKRKRGTWKAQNKGDFRSMISNTDKTKLFWRGGKYQKLTSGIVCVDKKCRR